MSAPVSVNQAPPSRRPPQDQAGRQAAFGRMAALLQMEERLRRAEKKELPFIAVNETRLLITYRQAVLWRAGPGGGRVMAVSGLAVPDKNAPYIQWLEGIYEHLAARRAAASPAAASHTDAPAAAPPAAAGAAASPTAVGAAARRATAPPAAAGAARAGGWPDPMPFTAGDLPPEKREDWADWLPPHGLFVPLPLWDGAEGELFGALAFFGGEPFGPAELRAARHLSGAYAQALSLAFAPRAAKAFQLSRRARRAAAAVLLLALLPLRQTVLAPAEVIAIDPWPVRAPIEGVVESILVAPNAAVAKGDPLLRLDTTELETRLAVAAKSLAVARAELRQAQQQAFADREAKLRLAYLSGRLEQLEAEKSYVESLLERAVPQSPVDGTALVDAPEEWAGKPVSLGQRIMTVADPRLVRLEIFMPADDYLPQKPGDEAAFFSNADPGAPAEALIFQVGFQAQETPQAGMAFRLRADFKPGENAGLRLGVRGSAKLYGPRAPLIYNLLRKPLAKLRQWIGV